VFKKTVGFFALIAMVAWAARPFRKESEYERMMGQYEREHGYSGR
jgi:hypothetical protein